MYALADLGGGVPGAHHPLWDPILSFSHTFSLKSACVGGPRPPPGRIQDLIGGPQIMTGLKLPFWGLSFVEFWCWGLIFGGRGGPGPRGPPGSAPAPPTGNPGSATGMHVKIYFVFRDVYLIKCLNQLTVYSG